MNCNKIKRLLPLYISDDLDELELNTVESHLNKCLNCYREYQSHLKAMRALKQLRDKPDLSSVLKGFSSGVMERIAHDHGGPAAPVPRVVHAFIPKAMAVAAGLLVLIMGSFFILPV